MNVTINRYHWRGARGKKGQHKFCSRDLDGWRVGFTQCSQRHRKWSCAHTPGQDCRVQAAGMQSNSKPDKGCFTCSSGTHQQHPYILWTSKTTATSDTTICHYFGETHQGGGLQRLIMPNFSSLLGEQNCTWTLAFSLLSPALPDF